MKTKGSVRRKSSEVFKEVVRLRKLGHSYTEIKNKTGVSKSTINNWIGLVGLNLSKEHLQIQEKKRIENHVLGTIASKITRAKRKDEDIQGFIQKMKVYFGDQLFVTGIMLYEAEGTKGESNGFSNSDFRLIKIYLKFLKRYLKLDDIKNISYRLYIHELRANDLQRLINFWSKKINIDKSIIKISWKHNKVSKRRENLDYVGQFEIRVRSFSHFTGKILAVSDIILSRLIKGQ